MAFCSKILKPILSGLVITCALPALELNAEEPDHSYLVSVQNMNGTKLCNGTYIGGNQILISPQCENPNLTWPSMPTDPIDFPDNGGVIISPAPAQQVLLGSNSITPELDSSIPSMVDYSDDEYPLLNVFSLGAPRKIVFTDRDGVESAPVMVKRRVKNPYSGAQTIVAVTHVPDNIRAMDIASIEQLAQLETLGGYPVQIVERGESGNLSVTQRELVDYAQCQIFSPFPGISFPPMPIDPLHRSICLTMDYNTCLLPDLDRTKYGAPIIAQLQNGEQVVVGMKSSECKTHPSASDHQRWAGLLQLKAEGLQVAMAYDLGERDKLEQPKLNVEFYNESADQEFVLSNLDLYVGSGFELMAHDCQVLAPAQSCTARFKVDVSDSVSHKDQITLNVNGMQAGIYTFVQGVAHRFVRGDAGALWKMNGWKKKGFFGGIYASSEFSTSPSLVRTRNIIDPKTMTVVYRFAGESTTGLSVSLTRKEMYNTNQIFGFGWLNLPGTNGEWVSKTFEFPGPGAYSVAIARNIYPTAEANQLDVEIESICFGDDC